MYLDFMKLKGLKTLCLVSFEWQRKILLQVTVHAITIVPFNPLTEHYGQRTLCLSLKVCLKCGKTEVYANAHCELNTADVTYFPPTLR